MAHIILVQFLIWLPLSLGAAEYFLPDADLGEKRMSDYKERYFPDTKYDHYLGGIKTSDQIFWDSYLNKYIFPEETYFTSYLNNELNAGMSCPDESLASKINDIRFSFRLIALSYLIEGQWHMNMVSKQTKLKPGCQFSLKDWLKTCHPKSSEMKSFISKLEAFDPSYKENLPDNYSLSDWIRELSSKELKYYSHYRIKLENKAIGSANVSDFFNLSCNKDQKLMTEICSENDELYGLSDSRDAYSLLSTSNIINSFNQKGDAVSCLRRFSEIMRHKEARYLVFKDLFNVMRAHLKNNYGERFLQGRVFFYGAMKEFEQKGLKNIFVEPQKFVIRQLTEEPTPEIAKPIKEEKTLVIAEVKTPKKEVEIIQAQPRQEVPKQSKSAFLQAAEAVKQSSLSQMHVDMLKLKYDHVFTLNMIRNLSSRLSIFMSREALTEMKKFDKLGSKDSPVPLLFIKYMIDMEEHKGLWNLIGVLGEKFYVSNQIDETYRTEPELVQLVNSGDSGSNYWQLYILKTKF